MKVEFELKPQKLQGIIPAIALPMGMDAKPDLETLESYLDWLLSFRLGGLAINADTGEGPHLHRHEKVLVLRKVAEVVGGRLPIIAGLNARFTEEAIEEAKDAKKAGADAVLVFPIPAFTSSPLPPEIPYEYHRAIWEEVGIPIVLFQLQPSLGGVLYEPETLRRLCGIEGIIALKEASFDALRYLQALRIIRSLERPISILTGNDNFIFESFLLGCDGGLLGLSNVGIDLQVEMFEALQKGDIQKALALRERVQILADAIFAPPVVDYRARIKEALFIMGIFKNAMVRPPLRPLGDLERARIKEALKKAGVLRVQREKEKEK